MAELDEIVGEFLAETYENLDRYDEDLLALERDPSDGEALGSIFRTVHTLKGTCGSFGFHRLAGVAHVAENLLARLRDGDLVITGEIASALLATGDAVRAMLADIEMTGQEGPSEHAELVAILERLHAPDAADPATAGDQGQVDHAEVDQAEVDHTEVEAADRDTRLGALLIRSGAIDAGAVQLALHQQELGDTRPLGAILLGLGDLTAPAITAALADQAAVRSRGENSIRVDVAVLDELRELVGELALVRDRVARLTQGSSVGGLTLASGQLDAITVALQDGVRRTRMQPIGTLWNKLPRVVRDLSLSVGKEVELSVVGDDTELDRTIIEAIKDPLTHLVRNAVDHGIEPAAVRRAAGKPAVGSLHLRASTDERSVRIEVADDGAGIDTAGLLAVAVEQGVVTPVRAAMLEEHAVAQLVFTPGLSTATRVTNVSGRGVGLDVVRTNVEGLGGSAEVHTTAGRGTTFVVRIPRELT